jgi:DNA-binding response OmpR family regulator
MKFKSALIIDDELDICILLKNFLKKKDARVSYATNLRDGFDKLKEINPDLLILDHNLPDGQGIENILKFKKQKKSLRVVVITAMSNLRKTALEKGADYFIEKPITFDKLNDLLAQ